MPVFVSLQENEERRIQHAYHYILKEVVSLLTNPIFLNIIL